MISWEGKRIYIGTEEIGKRAKIMMGNSADERMIMIDGEVVKKIKVDGNGMVLMDPPENKRTVYNDGRIHFDGHLLFVSKIERQKDVWIKTVEKDKVYAVYGDKEMTKEIKRIDISAAKNKATTDTIPQTHDSTTGEEQKGRERAILKTDRKVDDARTVKILQQRFYIKKTKPGQTVWVDEVVPGKEYKVFYDKDKINLARSIVLKEPTEKVEHIKVGLFKSQNRSVSVAGQINIFGKLVSVGVEHKDKEVVVRELSREQKGERRFGVFLGEQQLREIGIIKGKLVLDKGIRVQIAGNSGVISFKGDQLNIGGGFKNERMIIRQRSDEKGFDVFREGDFSSMIGTIVKGENGKHEYVAKESRLFASPSGIMKVDDQEVKLGLDHGGKAMRVVHERGRGEHVVFEDGEKGSTFGKVTCKDGTVVGFERYDKPAPVERKVSSSGKTGFYDIDVFLHPSYSGKKVVVVEEEIGKQFTIYKDGSLKEKVMTVMIGAAGDVKQRIENVSDYLGKVPKDVADKVVALGPARFEELKGAREAGGLVSELASKYGFSFEEMHALCTSAGVHIKGGDAMIDIKDILGHLKPHLEAQGIEDGKVWIKYNIEDHPAFTRPVDQARLGSVECLECTGSSGSGTSLAELTCKRYAEAITGVKFKKDYPEWLKSERGRPMELDMYSKELNVAIEMNGPQHYNFIPDMFRSREEYEKWQRSDALKGKKCNENGKDLIVIPYHEIYEKHKNTAKLRERVYKELNDRGLAKNKCDNLVYQTYHHGQVYYNFGRNTKKNAVLDDPKLPLKAFLQRVEREVPAGLFKDPAMPRASKQTLTLPKAESEAIGKELVRQGLVCKDFPIDQVLTQVARSVMQGDECGKGHDSVVQKALRECDGVAAVEVPVWARDKSMVGHVDIVRVDKDEKGVLRITIADFKTESEAKLARFVPQVEAYARMLESQLGDAGGARVECVLFNSDMSWRWNPGVLNRLATADPVLKHALDGENEKRKRYG